MKRVRKSSLSLVVLGALGVAFFYLTDPVFGIEPLKLSGGNVVDVINEATPGTWIGLAGSGAVLLLGLWLMTRRMV
jgi:hypothetical protein